MTFFRLLARRALAAGADYVGAGPVYPTGSKADAGEPLPPDRFAALVALCHGGERRVPLVAIGGIGPGRILPLVAAGADAVAVIRAVMAASDPGAAARELVAELTVARQRENR